MPVKNYLLELTDSEIIWIIEHPKNAGSVSKIEADNELASRNIAFETIRELAVNVTEKIAYEQILEGRKANNEVVQHTSNFLSKVEVWQIYINQFEKYKKNINVFIMPFFI
jgi:hypothetical protein